MSLVLRPLYELYKPIWRYHTACVDFNDILISVVYYYCITFFSTLLIYDTCRKSFANKSGADVNLQVKYRDNTCQNFTIIHHQHLAAVRLQPESVSRQWTGKIALRTLFSSVVSSDIRDGKSRKSLRIPNSVKGRSRTLSSDGKESLSSQLITYLPRDSNYINDNGRVQDRTVILEVFYV